MKTLKLHGVAVAWFSTVNLLGCASSEKEVFGNTLQAQEAALGVGDPCISADENSPVFPGFNPREVVIEFGAPDCQSGVCMVHHFQGRVSCPEGGVPSEGDSGASVCQTPNGEDVTVEVVPQLQDRPASDAVYCSCRCSGDSGDSPLCACPNGFECEPSVILDLGSAPHEVAGGYCVKQTE